MLPWRYRAKPLGVGEAAAHLVFVCCVMCCVCVQCSLPVNFWGEVTVEFFVTSQADRAYGTEISPTSFVISFVILLYAILYNICI